MAFIDTSGTFSPVRLRDILALRLHALRRRTTCQQSGYVYAKQPADPEPVTEALVQESTLLLDRVKLMRVFDVAGLVEAVGEITERCELVAEVPVETGCLRRGVVADSQDDLAGDGGSEGLDSGERAERPDLQDNSTVLAQSGKVGMVIVDAIADIFGPLMAKSQVQGSTNCILFNV